MKSRLDNFYRKKLANGLTVLFEKRNLPVVSTSATIKHGAIFEPEKIKGISHVIEHLMFKGTKTRSHEEIAKEIEKKGGIINAYTEEEVTSYWNKLPSQHLTSGINIASDLILNPAFDEKEFEKEKQVILEEIKMYHDNPRAYSLEKIKSLLYNDPFGMSIAGTKETVQSLSLQQVKSTFSSKYKTDNMILTVVGNANFEEICSLAGELYPKTQLSPQKASIEKINSDKVEQREGIDQAHFILGFHSPKTSEKEKYSYELAGAYLFGGMSSILNQEIREKRGLAYAVTGTSEVGREYGYSVIYVGTLKDKIKQVREIILKEIKNLERIEKKDFEECKEQLIGLKKIAEEDSVNTMNMLMMAEAGGSAKEHYDYDSLISSVKLGEVKKLSRLKAFSSFSLVPKI